VSAATELLFMFWVGGSLYFLIRNIAETQPHQVATKWLVALRVLLIVLNMFPWPVGLVFVWLPRKLWGHVKSV
jgi:hypothetical protein